MLSAKKITDLQRIAQKAIYDNAHGDVVTLIEDLQAGPLHVFGQHTNCKDYFCTSVGDTNNSEIVAVRSSWLYRLIQGNLSKCSLKRSFTCIKYKGNIITLHKFVILGALSLVIRKANCLIDNETNNRAELFMGILSRFTMGKRLNLIQRRSFETPSELATMRYNDGNYYLLVLCSVLNLNYS